MNPRKQKISRALSSDTPEEMLRNHLRYGRYFRKEAVEAARRGWEAERYREVARGHYAVAGEVALLLRRMALKAQCDSIQAEAEALLPGADRFRVSLFVGVNRGYFTAFVSRFSADGEPITKRCRTLEEASEFLQSWARARANEPNEATRRAA